MTTSTDLPERLSHVAEALSSSLLILDRFNHRHKNQHRVTTWWARFELFRRSVRRLVDNIDTYEQHHEKYAKPRSSTKQKERKEPNQLASQMDAVLTRARWLSGHVIPIVYPSFTQLVADQQHASLGLLLVGLTARVKAAIAPLVDDLQQSHPPQLTSTTGPSQFPSTASVGEGATSVDFGVVVSRTETSFCHAEDETPLARQPSSCDRPLQDQGNRDRVEDDRFIQQDHTGPAHLETSTKTRVSKKSTQKPKKRKKGDEFSELFGSLL